MNIETHHLSLVEEFLARHQSGLMTLVFTDLAGSTDLKKLGDIPAGAILAKHHELVRELLKTFRGAQEVDRPGDSFFIVFDSPSNAVAFSTRLHKKLRELSEEVGHQIRDRVGIHVGEVFFERNETDGHLKNFVSIQVDTCARVMGMCEAGRTLMTRVAFDNARQTLRGRGGDLGNLQWMSHGLFKLKGVDQAMEICEVWEEGRPRPTALGESAKAQRFFSATSISAESEMERAPGWRGIVARRWREVAISTGVAWVVVLIISTTVMIDWLEAVSYDLAYFLKPATLAPKEAVIVLMDETSHKELKQPDNAPWDHAIHARLVERLTKANPKVIAFDIRFQDPQPSSEAFIKACALGVTAWIL